MRTFSWMSCTVRTWGQRDLARESGSGLWGWLRVRCERKGREPGRRAQGEPGQSCAECRQAHDCSIHLKAWLFAGEASLDGHPLPGFSVAFQHRPYAPIAASSPDQAPGLCTSPHPVSLLGCLTSSSTSPSRKVKSPTRLLHPRGLVAWGMGPLVPCPPTHTPVCAARKPSVVLTPGKHDHFSIPVLLPPPSGASGPPGSQGWPRAPHLPQLCSPRCATVSF